MVIQALGPVQADDQEGPACSRTIGQESTRTIARKRPMQADHDQSRDGSEIGTDPENPIQAMEPTPSLWDHKPWWCQPWSIISTGVAVVALSWLGMQRWWISAPLALGVGVWWWLFLVVVPADFRQRPDDPGER